MITVACLIARTNSTRLREKVLITIAGKLLIEHIIDRIKIVDNISKIYICTSTEKKDQRLRTIAEKNGVAFYAGSPSSPIDRMMEVGRRENADNLVRVTGDNVFTDPIYLKEMIRWHEEEGTDYTRSMLLPIGLCPEVISMNAIERCYSMIDPGRSEYLMLYMFQPSIFSCQIILPEPDLEGSDFSLTVDTPSDLIRTQFIFDNIEAASWITYPEILDLNRKKTVPHFRLPSSSKIKLPDHSKVSFAYFKKDMEKRMVKSKLHRLKRGHYASKVFLLKNQEKSIFHKL